MLRTSTPDINILDEVTITIDFMSRVLLLCAKKLHFFQTKNKFDVAKSIILIKLG